MPGIRLDKKIGQIKNGQDGLRLGQKGDFIIGRKKDIDLVFLESLLELNLIPPESPSLFDDDPLVSQKNILK